MFPRVGGVGKVILKKNGTAHEKGANRLFIVKYMQICDLLDTVVLIMFSKAPEY